MTAPAKPSRLDVVRAGIDTGIVRRGRLVLSLDQLVDDPKNERRTYRNMDGLIASVKAVGIVEPITVSPTDGGAYMIITGHRRYRAAQAAGLAKVEVIVRDADEAVGRRRKSIISNVQRENVGPVELAEAMQALLDEDVTVKTQRDLASLIGKSEQWVSEMLRVLTLPGDLQAKLRASEVFTPYDAVTRIAREKDAALQVRLTEELIAGATSRDIRRMMTDAKKGDGGGQETQAYKRTHRLGAVAVTITAPTEITAELQRDVLTALLEQLFGDSHSAAK